MSGQPTVDELFIAAAPDRWRAAGFEVEGDVCEVGSVRLRLEGDGDRRGITRWSVRDTASLELDGLDTVSSEAPPANGGPHPNGTVSIDHVVVITPDLDRTATTFREAGFDLRRVREGETPGGSRRQAFFRMGELILEIVEAPEGTKIAADPGGPRPPLGHLLPGRGPRDARGSARRQPGRAARRGAARPPHRDGGVAGGARSRDRFYDPRPRGNLTR